MTLSKPNFTLVNKEWLLTAVNYCQGAMMDIGKFAKVIKHEICQETFDMFYVSLTNGYPIYLSKDIIKWFGYSGTDRDQKTSITNILKKNYIQGTDWFNYSQKEYKTLYNEINPIKIENKDSYKLPHPSESSNKTNHYIINSNIFEKVLLRSDSPKSQIIRQIYIDLKNLLFKYMEYQSRIEGINFTQYMHNIVNTPENKLYSRRLAIQLLEHRLNKNYQVGCVYYIQEEETTNIKIGWCWNLLKRLKCLQVANSQKLNIIKYELTQFPYQREQYLHNKYKNYLIRGEWYQNSLIN